MALKPEILKIYEDIIFQKKDDGSYEFTPHDNEDAEYFNYHFRKELGKLVQRQQKLTGEYRAHRPDSHIINRQIEISKKEHQDTLKKLKAVKLWADKNNIKLPIFESGKVLESIIKGFERRVNERVKEILSEIEKRFSDVETRDLGSNADTKVNVNDNNTDMKMQSRQLSIAHEKLSILTKRNRALSFANLSDVNILRIVDDTRKNNGTISYAKAARILGVHADTFRRLLKQRNLTAIAKVK